MPQYLQFSGAPDSQVSTPLPANAGDIYFSAWIMVPPPKSPPEATMNLATVSFTTPSGTETIQLGIAADGTSAAFLWSNGSGQSTQGVSLAASVFDGNWHNLAFYFAPSGCRTTLFVDGQVAADNIGKPTGSWPGEPWQGWYAAVSGGSPALTLGAAAPGTIAFTGAIANILLRTGVLSPAAALFVPTPDDLYDLPVTTGPTIPRVNASTLAVIALLPSELTTGSNQYRNLATNGSNLTIGSGVQVEYTTTTYLDGFSEMALYAPSAAFPDASDPMLGQALAYIVANAPGLPYPTLAALRASYVNAVPRPASYLPSILAVADPGNVGSGFIAAQAQLGSELTQAGVIQDYYSAVLATWTSMNLQQQNLLTTLEPLLPATGLPSSFTLDIGSLVDLLVTVVSMFGGTRRRLGGGLGDDAPFDVGGALEGVVCAVNLFDTDPSDSASGVNQQIQLGVQNLQYQVASAWDAQMANLAPTAVGILQDWGKLQLVNTYVQQGQLAWSLAVENTNQAWQNKSQLWYLRTLLPQVYACIVPAYPDGAACPDWGNIDVTIVPPQCIVGPGADGYCRAIGTLSPDSDEIVAFAPQPQLMTDVYGSLVPDPAAFADSFWYEWPWDYRVITLQS